jgi:UDP-N-acetylmuramate--alanine ligase
MTHVHFIGIGGSGLSAIARLMLESGYKVTGSDRALSPFARDLEALGVTIWLNHAPEHVRGADWVVRSSAVADDNPEVQAALQAGIPVYKRADFLGRLMQDKTGIAIAGTHGKTTTTGMMAFVLSQLAQDPSFIVGGTINNLGVNARAGSGNTFVIEADEYDRMFLGLKPTYAVVTNVEHDHPDCYPTAQDFTQAFEQFAALVPAGGALIACADDPGARTLAQHAAANGTKIVLYSTVGDRVAGTDWVLAQQLNPNNMGGFSFTASVNGQAILVALSVPGIHNVRNALAVLAVISLLGLPLEAAAQALGQFSGTGRRFEVLGEPRGITIVDDYAHHPTEIRATLAGARARYPHRRIWAIWQPHTYSRTQTLFNEFASAFGDADVVVVSEVYAAREPKQDFSAAQVVQAMNHPNAHFVANLPQITAFVLDRVQPGDVILTLSAGDATEVSAKTLAILSQNEVTHG